jgi:Icc-related predicted phosphoesterase
MLKLLTVSDITSASLESMVINKPAKFKGVDYIISCGDLESEYLEFLVDGINKDMYFVNGNHTLESPVQDEVGYTGIDNIMEVVRSAPRKFMNMVAGRQDLHGRIEQLDEYILVGFGGSMWYGGRGNEYSENEMQKVVKSIERKLRIQSIGTRFLKKKKKELIVISHAPIKGVHDLTDIAHTGFKCFREFLDKFKPLLWLHGHVHMQDPYVNQLTMVGNTTVLNAYGHKFIRIDKDKIEVSPRLEILDK